MGTARHQQGKEIIIIPVNLSCHGVIPSSGKKYEESENVSFSVNIYQIAKHCSWDNIKVLPDTQNKIGLNM